MSATTRLFGIKLAQDERRQANLGTFPYARDPRQANVVDPTVTWITENVQVSNNVFGNGNRNHSHLYALDGRTNRHVDTWNVTINGNLFNKVRFLSSEPDHGVWGKGDNVNLERYETPPALAAAKNSSLEECPAQHDQGDRRHGPGQGHARLGGGTDPH